MIMHNYEIWQVKDEFCRQFAFRSFDDVKSSRELKKEHYEKVYEGKYELSDCMEKENSVISLLEDLFCMFNENRPSDFTGRSMSLSDIVVIDGKKQFYCDRIGWKEI
jgi:hypothetical protein